MSAGEAIEIYKEKGRARRSSSRRFGLAELAGTHALGHTRMATESRVTTEHSHPFSTGLDLCLVHNGSLSNHNRLRRELRREGIHFETDNDTEVAAGYLTWRLREGASLEEALESCLAALDGFYTFAVGTRTASRVLRDPIACKPAVLAETDDWVAMASEYRAIAVLPGAADAERLGASAGRRSTAGDARRCSCVERCRGESSGRPRALSLRELNSRLHALAHMPDHEPLARAQPARRTRASRSGSTPTSRSRSRATSATTARA